MPTNNTLKRWLMLGTLLLSSSLCTACGPRVVSAPPSPSVKPAIPDFARKCPPVPSWLSQTLTCKPAPTRQPTR